MTEVLDRIAANTVHELHDFWVDICEIDVETSAQHVTVVAEIEKHRLAMKTVAHGDETGALAAMSRLVSVLNEANSGEAEILSTHEREIVVPGVLRMLEAKGVDPTRFDHGDPTLDLRDF